MKCNRGIFGGCMAYFTGLTLNCLLHISTFDFSSLIRFGAFTFDAFSARAESNANENGTMGKANKLPKKKEKDESHDERDCQ